MNIRYHSVWDESIEKCILDTKNLPSDKELNQCLVRHYNLDYDLNKLLNANAISKEKYEKYLRLNNQIQQAVCDGIIDAPDVYQEYLLRSWNKIISNSTYEELRNISKRILTTISEVDNTEEEKKQKIC